MTTEGTGGRSLSGGNDRVITGVLADGRSFRMELSWGRCLNPRCQRLFSSRQEGDIYCCEPCDLDDNKNLRGSNAPAFT